MTHQTKGIDLVLGAGGVKGFGHIGVLRALHDLKVEIGSVTGVSVGSLIAAMYTNGLSLDQIFAEMYNGMKNRNDPAILLKTLSFPDPISFMVGGSIDLTVPMREMVARLNLKTNDRLKIVSCDYFRKEPVLFAGENYDLAKAITASCALPTVMRPVWQMSEGGLRLLVDGAVYHYNPTDFCSGEAIVSSFLPATEPTSEWQQPIDLYFHYREMFMPIAGQRRYVDPSRHVVIEVGLPDVAGLNYGLSLAKCQQMEQDGYDRTIKAITAARAAGRLDARLEVTA